MQEINLKSRLITKLKKIKMKRKDLANFMVILVSLLFLSLVIKTIEKAARKWQEIDEKREFQEIIRVHWNNQHLK